VEAVPALYMRIGVRSYVQLMLWWSAQNIIGGKSLSFTMKMKCMCSSGLFHYLIDE
jgi:hypothetical protein